MWYFSLFVFLLVQCNLGIRTKKRLSKSRVGACPLAGLKVQGINSMVKVMHPVPLRGSSPFKDESDDTYTFKDLGDFDKDGDMHYLHANLNYGTGGKWIISAAVPLNVYMNFLSVASPGRVPQPLEGKWHLSSKKGVVVSYTGYWLLDNDTYTPETGVVVSRSLAAGKTLEIPVPAAFYGDSRTIGQFLMFVKPVCGDDLIQCPMGGWRKLAYLDSGAQGDIYRVTHVDPYNVETSPGLEYAMKVSNAPVNENDIRSEREIALAASSCTNVLDIVDAQPCVLDESGFKLASAAYVMPLMADNIQNWFDVAPERRKERCFNTIQNQLSSGIECLHSVGRYVHGDLKGDNAMYRSLDESTNCPEGIQLIDFGKARVRGSKEDSYPSHLFPQYTQYPTGIFHQFQKEWPLRPTPLNPSNPDTLGIALQGEVPQYLVEPNLDWCMYLFMLRTWYGLDLPWWDTSLDCGMMGPKRQWWMKASRIEIVEGDWPPPLPRPPPPPAKPEKAETLRLAPVPEHVKKHTSVEMFAQAPVAKVQNVEYFGTNGAWQRAPVVRAEVPVRRVVHIPVEVVQPQVMNGDQMRAQFAQRVSQSQTTQFGTTDMGAHFGQSRATSFGGVGPAVVAPPVAHNGLAGLAQNRRVPLEVVRETRPLAADRIIRLG